MKYRSNWYCGDRGQRVYIIECNDTDKDDADYWLQLKTIELEDEIIINYIVDLLNSKYSKDPLYKTWNKYMSDIRVGLWVKAINSTNSFVKEGQKFLVVDKGPSPYDIIIDYYGEQLSLSSSIFEPATKYDLFDVVVITVDSYDIPVGQVGTIVEIFNKDNKIAYEVEFCDDDGRTLYQDAIEEDHIIKLKFN